MNFDEIFPDEIVLLILEYLPIQDLMNATRLPLIYRLVKDRLWWVDHRTPHQRAKALEFAFERGVGWIKETLLYSCVSVREFEDLFYRPIKATTWPPIQFDGVSDADDALSLTISEGYWWLIEPLISRWKANPDYTEYHRWSSSNFWEDALVVEAAVRAVELKEPRILTEMLKCGADPYIRSNGGNASNGPSVDRKLGCYHRNLISLCDGWDDDGIDERCDPNNNYDGETYKLIKYLRKKVSKSRQKLRQKLNSKLMFG